MARARFENLELERQETILTAAAEEFAARGYGAASLNRVIEAAGISKGSLYYYFDDKADLFASVVQEAMDRMMADMGGLDLESLEASTYWNALRDYALASVDLMHRDVWYMRLVLAFPRLRRDPAAMDAVRPALEWGRRLTRELLERGVELGVVRQDLPLDLLVEVVMAADEAGDRWMAAHLDEYQGEALVGLVDARVDLLRDMLDAENEGWES